MYVADIQRQQLPRATVDAECRQRTCPFTRSTE